MHGTITLPGVGEGQRRDIHAMEGIEASSPYDLRLLAGLVRRQGRTILIAASAVMLVMVIILFQLRSTYQATALLLIDQRQAELLQLESGTQNFQTASARINTEVEIVRSGSVVERAIKQLDLNRDPEFRHKENSLVRGLKDLFWKTDRKSVDANLPYSKLDPRDQAAAITRVSRNLRISRRGLTNVISIAAVSESPEKAAKLANAVASAYLDEVVEARVASTSRVASYLQSRVAELANELSANEARIDTFISKSVSSVSNPDGRARLQRLNQLIETEQERRQAVQTDLKRLQQTLLDADYSSLGDVAMTKELGAIVEKRQQILANTALPPDQVRQELDQIDRQLRKQIQRGITGLQNEISQSEQTETELKSNLRSAFISSDLSASLAVPLYQLQRNMQATRDLYDSFLSRLREMEQRATLNTSESRVISAAKPPLEPAYPPQKLIFFGSLIFALGLGFASAVLRENYIGGFNSMAQVQSVTGVPVIAEIPHCSTRGGSPTPDQAVISSPLSTAAEAVRRLRLSVEGLGKDDQCTTVLFTSALAGEGKSTLALALARTAALAGTKTILIDADLRRPTVNKMLRYTPRVGLLSLLADQSSPIDLGQFTKKDAATNLEVVLGAGESRVPTDTLLASDRFNQLLQSAKRHHQLVILDGPPVGLLVDPLILARHADAVIFAVQWASTSQRSVNLALQQLRGVDDLRLYAALNQVDDRSLGRYSYRYAYTTG